MTAPIDFTAEPKGVERVEMRETAEGKWEVCITKTYTYDNPFKALNHMNELLSARKEDHVPMDELLSVRKEDHAPMDELLKKIMHQIYKKPDA